VRRLLWVLVLLGWPLMGADTGRGMLGRAIAAQAAGPDLPTYAVGDAFTFSDGRTETVVGVRGEFVDWRNDLGFAFTTFRNFLLPRESWQGSGRRGETALDASPELLWPLVPGHRADFLARRAVILETEGTRRDFLQSWSCRVEAQGETAVPAGVYDGYRLVCERRDDVAALRETKTWFYAPAIGHFLRLEDNRDGTVKRRELVAFHRSSNYPVDPAEATFQRALESLVSGSAATWQSPDKRRSIAVTPLRTFRRDSLYCRDYRQVTDAAGEIATWMGTACRQSDRQWLRQLPENQ